MDRIENRKTMEPERGMTAKEMFEAHDGLTRETGRPVEHCGIGWAIKQLHHGLKVRRRGWNGRGMYLELQIPDLHSKMTLPYVYMSTAQGDLIPWLCSQTDLLAMDWEIATAD